MVGREVRRPLDTHPSQARKEGLVAASTPDLGIDQDNPHRLAVQKAPMLWRNVENAIVGNGLKFYCVHGHNSASFTTTRRAGPARPARRHRLRLRLGDLGQLLDV
jgi:hypothetical protein